MKTPRMVKSIVAVLCVVVFSTNAQAASKGGAKSRLKSFQIAQADVDADLEAELELDSPDAAAGDAATPEVPAEGADAQAELELPPAPELPPEEAGSTAAEPPPQPDPVESAAPAEVAAEGPAATITALDFKGAENGGTVVIKATGALTYTTRSNPGNQFVIEIQNAILPKKFQRPYNTKDFSGPIALINGYQKAGSKTARIIVQMKEAIEPTVQQEGNSLLVMALGGASMPMAEAGEAPAESAGEAVAPPPEEPAQAAVAEVAPSVDASADSDVLKGRTLDEFLSGTMKFYGRPISIQVKDGDLRDVFNFISEESGLNLVLTEEVQGKISLKLKEIPWDQALVVVMQSKQLGYIRQGNVLRIATLKAIRAESDATKDVIESQKQLQPLKVRIFPVSYAQAKDLEPQAQAFLTLRGKVRADARTNSLVVTDVPEVLNKVAKLLGTLDTQTPQVLIEGKIVEARETFSREIGVSWNWSPNETRSSSLGTSNIANQTIATTNTALTLGPAVGRLFSWDTIAAKLQLYESEDKVKVLSSPRIVTLNNMKAVIQQASETPLAQTTISSAGAQQTTVTYKSAKLLMGVTPQITAEGGVILSVDVSREFFSTEKAVAAGVTAAPLNTRQAQTTVLVNNGETAVIGGIYQSDEGETETGIPGLRKIPLIGRLFSGSNVRRDKNELLIFLSPRVLNKDQAFGANKEELGGGDSAIE